MASTGTFPIFSVRDFTSSKVSFEVAMPLINSTSAIKGTGFMKCMPMNFSARLVKAAKRVMEMDDVLLVMITAGSSSLSSSKSSFFFTSKSSKTASTTKSTSPMSANCVEVFIRERILSLSSSIFPFSESFVRLLSTAFIDRWSNSSAVSFRTTSNPEAAATWAIPVPIVPAPTTPIFLTAIIPPCSNQFHSHGHSISSTQT
ncbi:hypothetical protein ES703_04346 [subsurface metagenome]